MIPIILNEKDAACNCKFLQDFHQEIPVLYTLGVTVMEKYVNVTCWGSRGSCAAPHTNRMEYGGNTSCFVIETESVILILDAGSGIVPFGDALIGRRTELRKEICLLFGHLHLDHIIGLPSFKPIYRPEYRVWIYGGGRTGGILEEQLEAVFGPPYWPVRLRDCPAYAGSRGIMAGTGIELPGDISVRAVKANHPDQTVSYVIFINGKKIVYALDCELDQETERELLFFAADADLLICDAQYSQEDYEVHRGWGHSAWPQWAGLAARCNVREVWLSHYAWEYCDEDLRTLENKLRKVLPRASCAKEGMEIRL